MWRNIVLILLTILLIEALINFKLIRTLALANSKVNEFTIESDFLREDITQIQNREELSYKSEFSKVNPKTLLITQNNDSIFIKDVLKSRGKLVFYYGDQYCELCYKELLNHINSYISKTGTEDIIFLVEYSTSRSIHYFIKNNEIKTKIYFVPKDISFPAKENKTPFFFVLDSTFTAKFVFIPTKKYLSHIENYFKIIDDYLK